MEIKCPKRVNTKSQQIATFSTGAALYCGLPSKERRKLQMSKKYLLFAIGLILAFATLACGGQVKAVPPTSGIPVSYQGISFIIPTTLANATTQDAVPASQGLVMWPEHIQFTLEEYPLKDKAFEPQISVFPVAEYAQMSNEAEAMIAALQSLVALQQVSSSDVLPFLPEPRAQQMLHAQEKFITFENGNGIRYITEYSQAAFPNISGDMFYTFQGLTDDGKYYVSIRLPIELPQLTGVLVPENADQYPGYLTSTIELLNHKDNAFTPSLEVLDVLVQSLQVQK